MIPVKDTSKSTTESVAQTFASSSPLSSEYETILSCTMPSLEPSWNLPDSPPGSPLPALEKKFAHFRMLKQNNIHLNANLDRSLSFQNPRLLDKLVDYVGIQDQYGSNLPENLQTWKKLQSVVKTSNLAKVQEQPSTRPQRTDIHFVPERISFKNTR